MSVFTLLSLITLQIPLDIIPKKCILSLFLMIIYPNSYFLIAIKSAKGISISDSMAFKNETYFRILVILSRFGFKELNRIF